MATERYAGLFWDVDGDDPPLDADDLAIVGRLTDDDLRDIDDALIRHARPRLQKVAMIVAKSMEHFSGRFDGLPATFFAQRVVRLVEHGELEGVGRLSRMRYSEVRLIHPADGQA